MSNIYIYNYIYIYVYIYIYIFIFIHIYICRPLGNVLPNAGYFSNVTIKLASKLLLSHFFNISVPYRVSCHLANLNMAVGGTHGNQRPV